jgi:hypothetical protein
MTTKEKYELIDKTKVSAKVLEILEKMEKASSNFTNAEVNSRVDTALDKIIEGLKVSKPEALLSVSDAKKEVKKEKKDAEEKNKGKDLSKKKDTDDKTGLPKKDTVEERKDIIKKESESEKEARERAKKELEKENEKAKDAIESQIEKLNRIILEDPALRGFNTGTSATGGGKSTPLIDAERKAIARGRRVSQKGRKNQYGASAGGRVYWENRENRSDRKSPDYPTGKPYLEKGGNVYASEDLYEVKMVQDGVELDSKLIRARNKGEARMIFEDMYQEKYQDEFGAFDLEIDIAKDRMADGGGIPYKPYGKTKGRFTLKYEDDGEQQSEIWSSLEEATNSARRYVNPKLGYTNVQIYDESGKEYFFADGGMMADGGKVDKRILEKVYESYDIYKDGTNREHYDDFDNIEKVKEHIEKRTGMEVLKIKEVEIGRNYPDNMSHPYYHDDYEFELVKGQPLRVERMYGRPNYSGNVAYTNTIEVKNLWQMADGGVIGNGKNGYVAFYKGKKIEVYADTMYGAQKIASKHFKAKNEWEVNVVLAEVDGKPYIQSTAFANGGMMADSDEIKNLIGKEFRPFTATSNNEYNVKIVNIDLDNVTYKHKDGQVKKSKTSDFLDSYIQVKTEDVYMADGGYTESGEKLYEIANNMSDKEFQEAYRNLSEKEKDLYDTLLRLGDEDKIALVTVLNESKKPKYDKSTWDLHRYAKGGLVEEIKMFDKYNYPIPKTKGDKVRAIFEHFKKKGYSTEEINTALSKINYAKGGEMADGGETESEPLGINESVYFEVYDGNRNNGIIKFHKSGSRIFETLLIGNVKAGNRKYMSYFTKNDLKSSLYRDFDVVNEVDEDYVQDRLISYEKSKPADILVVKYPYPELAKTADTLTIIKGGEQVFDYDPITKDFSLVSIGLSYPDQIELDDFLEDSKGVSERQYTPELIKVIEVIKENEDINEIVDGLKSKGLIKNYMMAEGGEVDFSERMAKMRSAYENLQMSVKGKIASAIGIDEAVAIMDTEYSIHPFNLIFGAVRGGLLELDEINKDLVNEAVDEAERVTDDYRDSGQGIGGSDMTYFTQNVLNSAGYKTGFINNTLKRVDADGNELVIDKYEMKF